MEVKQEVSQFSGIYQVMPFADPVTTSVNPPKVMARGEGCRVVDEDGNSYLEMVAGLWCAGLGFTNEAVTTAVTEQMRRLGFYHGFMGKASRPPLDLAERLVRMTPEPLGRVLFANSGSEAVDTAIKLVAYYNNARARPQKKKIIAREHAYHGSGVTSAVLTGMEYCHHGFDLPADRIRRTGSPHYHRFGNPGESQQEFARRRARELEELIIAEGPDTVGAFIGEPVQGSGGVIIPPADYWPEIQKVLKRHDVLLIVDEVICGFHRTGAVFGSDTYGIRPDMMVVAKQLSGGFVPISALLISDDIHEHVARAAHDYGTLGYGFTYSGHPVAAAAALATLDEYERREIPARVNRLARVLEEELASMATQPGVGDVRSVGLLGAVEMDESICRQRHDRSAADTAAAIVREAERNGVIFRAADQSIALCPPMIIDEAELAEMGSTLRAAIRTVMDG